MPLNAPRTLTDAEISGIASAIAEGIAAKLNAKAAEPEVINRREAMEILRCKSSSVLDSTLKSLKVRRVLAGKFRRKDILNAFARRALNS